MPLADKKLVYIPYAGGPETDLLVNKIIRLLEYQLFFKVPPCTVNSLTISSR